MEPVAPMPVNPANIVPPKKKLSPALLVFLLAGIIAIIAAGYFYLKSNQQSNQQNENLEAAPANIPQETRQPTADETEVNISISNKAVYVICPIQKAGLVKEAVDKTKEALAALENCKSDKCIKDLNDANNNLLSLIKQNCKQ